MDIIRSSVPPLKRFIWNRNFLAILLFILFILVNTLKVSAFHLLIVDATGFPSFANLMKAFWEKIFLVGTVGLILLRLRWRWPCVIFYCLQTLYITANLMYFFSFHGYLHVGQYLGLFSEGIDLVTHAALPWDSRSLFILVDLPLLAAVLFFYPRLAGMNKRYFFKPFMYSASVLFLWLFYKWEPPLELPLQTMNNAYSSDAAVVSEYGLLIFNIMDLLNYADARSHIRQLNYGPPMTAPAVDSTHPDIIVIQVESLDAKIINYKYRNEFVTPWLHSLSGRCIFFPYTLSYHLAGSTSDCEFSILNSVEPFDNYPSMKIRNYSYPNSLPKCLSSCGYSIEAFHGNRGTYFNRTVAYKKMGFDKFYDMAEMGVAEAGWGATDESVFSFVTTHLAARKKPVFYYIITMCTHEPFIFVKQYYTDKKYNAIKDGARRNYLNSMSYLDKELKKFITGVRAVSPDAVIIMYGDHTPTLPKCDYSKAVITRENRLFEFVPLFILLPEKKVYTERTLAASFLDIAPTILAASRCSGQIRSYGQNLLSTSLQNREIPFRKAVYGRKELFSQIAKKK